MSAARRTIRSYQRVFRPDRRLHSIEGRALPVPGGVPLRGLGYAGAALGAVLVLGTGSILVYLAVGACAATAGAVLGGRDGAALAGASGLAGAWVVGQLMGALDWPIRLLLIPAAVAMVGTQTTPDGRPAYRFAAAWLALRLSPRRRSLGRPLPAEDIPRAEECELWVSADEHSPSLRRSRIRGEGQVAFAKEISASRSRLRQRRIRVRPAVGSERPGELRTTLLAVAAGETVEVRA